MYGLNNLIKVYFSAETFSEPYLGEANRSLFESGINSAFDCVVEEFHE